MAEYVDKKSVIGVINEAGFWEKEDQEVSIYCVEQTKSVDVAPVKHGRLIDADALCEGKVDNDPTVIEAKCAQTIDAVPVVRCKDCEHYLSEINFCSYIHGIRCDVAPDWYCSNGQRREDKSDE